MVQFLNLLKSNNQDAQAAHAEYSSSQNKERFYSQIIALCRKPVSAPRGNTSDPAPSAVQKQGKHCFLFKQGKCNRSNCKFGHTLENQSNSSSTPASKPQQASAAPAVKKESPASARQPQAVSAAVPQPVERNSSKGSCQFYMTNGCCRKGDKCKYAHPGSDREGNSWVDNSRSAVRGIVSVDAKPISSSKILASKIGVTLSEDDMDKAPVSSSSAVKSNEPEVRVHNHQELNTAERTEGGGAPGLTTEEGKPMITHSIA